MAKSKVLKVNKVLLFAAMGLLFFGGTAYAGYQLGTRNTKSDQQNSENSGNNTAGDNDPDHLEASESPGGQLFETYKKQIEDNKATGTDMTGLYINAALTGASVNAPEAKEYAKAALDQMSDAMKKDSRNQELIIKLQKIAEAN